MIVWLVLQVFQFMFDVHVTGDALILLQIFGFIELFIEAGLLAVWIVISIEERGKK